MRSKEITTVLPTNWRQPFPAPMHSPRVRYPRDTASLALTTKIPVVAQD